MNEQLHLYREELDRWRSWAQFVFLGGGPLTMNDDELRQAVCQKFDDEKALHDPEWAAAQQRMMGLK